MADILVVEDERHLAEGICENLEAEGYQVTWRAEGTAALEAILKDSFDLILLDVMLPGLDGFSICREARARGCESPILFLTARGGTEDRIRGLELGGDDYLPKPFALRELLLRVSAILRRSGATKEAEDRLYFGENCFDRRSFQATTWSGAREELSRREALILLTLAEQEGAIVSREDILDRVWGNEVFPSTRTIDNFILRLRRRFEPDPEAPVHFHTVRGVGYRFTREAPS